MLWGKTRKQDLLSTGKKLRVWGCELLQTYAKKKKPKTTKTNKTTDPVKLSCRTRAWIEEWMELVAGRGLARVLGSQQGTDCLSVG